MIIHLLPRIQSLMGASHAHHGLPVWIGFFTIVVGSPTVKADATPGNIFTLPGAGTCASPVALAGFGAPSTVEAGVPVSSDVAVVVRKVVDVVAVAVAVVGVVNAECVPEAEEGIPIAVLTFSAFPWSVRAASGTNIPMTMHIQIIGMITRGTSVSKAQVVRDNSWYHFLGGEDETSALTVAVEIVMGVGVCFVEREIFMISNVSTVEEL